MARHRLVVGVDYGTTYSGISYVTTDKRTLEDINVIRSWPGKDGEWKTPTRIAYAVENQRIPLTEDHWGYQAEAPMTMCSWTKLLLDAETRTAYSDDRRLQADIESGKLRIPAHRNPQGVAADFLRELHKHMRSKLVKELGPAVYDSTPMDVWLTVPAVWSDKAQHDTKQAALEGGFGARQLDTITVITEPEAAATAVLKNISRPEALNKPEPGSNIMICDCGGGTVDITSYTVTQLEPVPNFEEIVVGTGAKCGATSIDRELHNLMSQRFGAAWDRIEERRKGAGSNFMEKWERVKRQFGDVGDDRTQELQLNIRGAMDSVFYDEEEGMVRLTKSDVRQIFEPTVQEIIRLVSQQNYAIQDQGKRLHRLVLVGGFGESPYLFSRLREWCQVNGVQPYCPEYPQAAIVRGAALRGLIGAAPRVKRCRRHYGVKVSRAFRPNVDPECDAIINNYTRVKMCKNRMLWMIAKGDEIKPGTCRNHPLSLSTKYKEVAKETKLLLYSCNLDTPPERWQEDVDFVGTIKVDFSSCSLNNLKTRREHRWHGEKYQQIPFDVQIEFGSTSGILQVRALYDGMVAGAAEMDFDTSKLNRGA